MNKLFIPEPITGLPIIGNRAVKIVGKNKRRTGLIINNYGTQAAYIYDAENIVQAGNGFTINSGFGLALVTPGSCPQSEIFAGQAAAGAILNIIEIVSEEG